MRYQERRWSDPLFELPGLDERMARTAAGLKGGGSIRYGTTVTDAVFMTSRDGVTFKRWGEAFIRPGPRQRQSWVYGDNFVFWGMVETQSPLDDAPDEISLYATESYWEGTDTKVRRYASRVDGFVSVNAPLAGGEIVTRPLVFDGGNLVLNFETSGAGDIQVELQNAAGCPLPGYALCDCPPILGDSLRHVVRWAPHGGDVRALAGQPVRLRFVLRDADLYAFQFVPYASDPVRVTDPFALLLPAPNPDRQSFHDDKHVVVVGVMGGWGGRSLSHCVKTGTGTAQRASFPARQSREKRSALIPGNCGEKQHVSR
jgi:hypothetical protein